jgi:hypothetical protein
MSTETMLAAVAKRAATREARGTRGPKAKLKIKGVVLASPPAAPEPSPEPTHASSAGPAPTREPEVPHAPAASQERAPDPPPTPLS